MRAYLAEFLYVSTRIRSNRIGRCSVKIIASSKREVVRCGIYISFANSPRKAPAATFREEVSLLMRTAPGLDLERLETFRPSCTGVIPDINTGLDDTTAVVITVGVNDKGGSAGSETSHDGDGGDGETHLEKGREP